MLPKYRKHRHAKIATFSCSSSNPASGEKGQQEKLDTCGLRAYQYVSVRSLQGLGAVGHGTSPCNTMAPRPSDPVQSLHVHGS